MPLPNQYLLSDSSQCQMFQTLCFVYYESVTIKAFNPFNILSMSELKLFWDCWWKMRGRSCFNKCSALIAGAETFPDPELAIWKACCRRLLWQRSRIFRGESVDCTLVVFLCVLNRVASGKSPNALEEQRGKCVSIFCVVFWLCLCFACPDGHPA